VRRRTCRGRVVCPWVVRPGPWSARGRDANGVREPTERVVGGTNQRGYGRSVTASQSGSAPDHDAASYGARVADGYDAIYDGVWDTDGAVRRLVELAGGGPVLELGVGTGRIAIPLSARGLEVHGIDGSAEMLELLKAKPGGDLVTVTCGDFSETTVAGPFSLVALLVNTIYAMADQDAQVRCFINATRHLGVGGRFVVEGWVPDPPRPGHQHVRGRRLAKGLAGLVIEEHDPVAQTLATTQIVFSESGQMRMFPVVHRYAWPSELDLMARLAGLTLESRWADWHETPFEAGSANHVSVWRRDRPDLTGLP